MVVVTNTMWHELEPYEIEIINVSPTTVNTSFDEKALREEEHPGLCPTDRCNLPRLDMATQILDAAAGPPGEVWLKRQAKVNATAAVVWPKSGERRLASLRDEVSRKGPRAKRRWRLLQVESAIACNLRCVMCPWKKISKKAANHGIMTQEIWDSTRPHLPEVLSIDFTGGGEPLLQPKLVEWIRDAKAAGCEAGFLTNALLLRKEMARKVIEAGIDWICISMDGADAELYERIRKGSSFQRVCENVKNIAELRQGKIPKTMINFVLMDINFHQVEDIVKLAARLGVDQVNFKQCDVIREEQGKGFGVFELQETKAVRRMKKTLDKARRLGKKLNVQTTAFSFTPHEKSVCDQDPRNSLFIRYDGTVAPCINLAYGGPTTFLGKEVTMPSVHYGRLPDQDLLELWGTTTCKFYKQRFKDRVAAHEDSLIKSLMNGSSVSRERAEQTALNAMPEPPQGCNVCHYLYDI